MMRVRLPLYRHIAVLYWSASWFTYAKAKGRNPWLSVYHMSYGGFTVRVGKLTFAVVPKLEA